MKEAFGGTWLFQIVIFLIILMSGYLCLSINHTKAFNVKNDIVTLVERHGNIEALIGYEKGEFESDVAEALEREGYRVTGTCDTGWTGYDRSGVETSLLNNNAFCLKKIQTKDRSSDNDKNQRYAYYYQIKTFYQLDIPIFRSIFNLSIQGETKVNYIRKYQ